MNVEQQIMDVVGNKLAANRLLVPTMPEVAISVGEMIRQDEVDAAAIAEEVAKDAGIAARLLAIANNIGARGAAGPAENLTAAITRLGFHHARVIVSRIAIEQMFRAHSPTLRGIMERTWSRSLEVAALSRALATECTRLNGETAMLAGLVHLIGVLPLIKLFDDNFQLAASEQQFDRVITAMHPQVAGLVLRAWKFPADLVLVPECAFNFSRTHSGDADYVDVTTVSILQSYAAHSSEFAEKKSRRIPAFEKLGLTQDVETKEMKNIQDAFIENLETLLA
jgi:HD-like signal output (HDOD) protein